MGKFGNKQNHHREQQCRPSPPANLPPLLRPPFPPPSLSPFPPPSLSPFPPPSLPPFPHPRVRLVPPRGCQHGRRDSEEERTFPVLLASAKSASEGGDGGGRRCPALPRARRGRHAGAVRSVSASSLSPPTLPPLCPVHCTACSPAPTPSTRSSTAPPCCTALPPTIRLASLSIPACLPTLSLHLHLHPTCHSHRSTLFPPIPLSAGLKGGKTEEGDALATASGNGAVRAGEWGWRTFPWGAGKATNRPAGGGAEDGAGRPTQCTLSLWPPLSDILLPSPPRIVLSSPLQHELNDRLGAELRAVLAGSIRAKQQAEANAGRVEQ
ncbi:unnamed protein product [Closterium sp. NIES-64]|nr:unnamed protein product [Closterium sp. NIES-64]